VERDRDGNPVRAAGSFLNINDRKSAEAHLSRLEIQARQSQKLESLGVFVGGIAHDFNNLLTAVLGNLYLLQRSSLDGDVRELAADAVHAAERGADLVRRLLTYARPEVAPGESIALDPLLDETAALARSMLTPTIRLTVRHSREPGKVNGSRTSLQQVLLNLFVNARDAMADGGRITVSRRIAEIGPHHRWAPPELPRGRYHVISVSDTGAGMSADVVERIFDPFFTTKGVGRGTGLGLSTALGIARAHRGWLTVESSAGVGSTFRLLLPVPE
jgi:signal transduction histidine kinase